jgi:predicted glycoside hydrolase/deacetylase ChbG (UPF0249 family)
VTLVVTADDLGISPAVTKGILEAHRRGIVRSTSLLVTFPAGQESAALARAERDLDIGLHLDLVGGTPASDPAAVRSLVDPEGRFWRLREFARRLVTGRIRSGEVARELRAQMERARSWGAPTLAWDSHRNTHLMPPVARIVGPLAREFGVRWLRRARPPAITIVPKAIALHGATLVSELAFRGIPGNRWYVDVTSARPRLDAAAVALLAMHAGVGEISGHPGYVDDELRRVDDLVQDREYDLELFTDELLVEALGHDAVVWRVR